MNEIIEPLQAVSTGMPNSFIGWLAAVATGVPLLGIGIQKAFRSWSADRKVRISDDAVSDTIKGLRAECDRLRTHNMELVSWFERAQLKIVTIAGENSRLQVELDELKDNLSNLVRKYGINDLKAI